MFTLFGAPASNQVFRPRASRKSQDGKNPAAQADITQAATQRL